ncbi:MAG: hypothetical protein ACLUHE_16265 [Christensenellales bacterium]
MTTKPGVELTATTVDDHPAHVITIYGRENATVYLREMQTSYVIADGKVSITVPDYMWYDTESSTFATAVETGHDGYFHHALHPLFTGRRPVSARSRFEYAIDVLSRPFAW